MALRLETGGKIVRMRVGFTRQGWGQAVGVRVARARMGHVRCRAGLTRLGNMVRSRLDECHGDSGRVLGTAALHSPQQPGQRRRERCQGSTLDHLTSVPGSVL